MLGGVFRPVRCVVRVLLVLAALAMYGGLAGAALLMLIFVAWNAVALTAGMVLHGQIVPAFPAIEMPGLAMAIAGMLTFGIGTLPVALVAYWPVQKYDPDKPTSWWHWLTA